MRWRSLGVVLSCAVFVPWQTDTGGSSQASWLSVAFVSPAAAQDKSRRVSRPGLATLGGLANQQKTVQAIQQAQAVAAQIQQVQAAQQRAEQLAQKVVAQQKQIQNALDDQNDRNPSGTGQAGVRDVPASDKDSRQRAALRDIIAKLGGHKQMPKAGPQPVPATAKKDEAGAVKVAGVADSNLGGVAAGVLGATMSKLGGPQPPKQANAIAPGSDRSAKPRFRVLGGRPLPGALLPGAGTFKSNELIAINLDASALKASAAGGFKVEETIELPALGFTVSRLTASDDEGAINGRKKLYEQVPDGEFAFNRVYAPYRMGLGLGGPVKTGKGCASERCFGADLIKWQPHLADCAQAVKVGIIDTGYDQGHPAFKKLAPAYATFVPPKAKLVPQHGTAVLSILAGDPESSTPGLIPNAKYYIANAFYADSGGQAMSDTTYVLAALDWLMKEKVAVVNLSFSGPEDELIHAAIRKMTSAGIVVVAAAGNDGPSAPPSYPAAYKEVIAVTAVDRNRAPYNYANRGPYIDLAAPGVSIWAALPGDREGAQTGTSFAVPYVTAVVAANQPPGAGSEANDPMLPKRLALAPILKTVKGVSGQGMGAGLVQAPQGCVARLGSWTSTVHAVSAGQ